jgi:CHAT domain-containing protein
MRAESLPKWPGIAGLARAFFYAGTPSVIVSVWDVADQPTNRLLPDVYRLWLNGADKAGALRAAQLSLIRSLRAGRVKVTLPAGTFVLPEDPVFWAAFVLLGEPD